MRLCMGAGNVIYCCPHPDGSESECLAKLNDEGFIAGTHEGVCYATALRINYSVKTKDFSNEYFLFRVPYMYFDSSTTISFVARPDLVLSFLTTLANETTQITKIKVGSFIVPTEIVVATLLDDCSAFLGIDRYIVTGVNVSQRGGSLIELEIRGVRKSSVGV